MRYAIFAIGLFAGPALAGPALAGHQMEGRDINQGEAHYGEHCAACHGANLEGAPDWNIRNTDGTWPAPPHDETGHTWHHDDQLLFDYTKLGGAGAMALRGMAEFNSGMPGFGEDLSDAEIWNILAFIRASWPAPVQEMQASRNPPHDG